MDALFLQRLQTNRPMPILCFTDGNSDREPVNLKSWLTSELFSEAQHCSSHDAVNWMLCINGCIILQHLQTNQPMSTPYFADGKQLGSQAGKFKCMANSAIVQPLSNWSSRHHIYLITYNVGAAQSAVFIESRFSLRNTFGALAWPHRFSICLRDLWMKKMFFDD